MDFQSEFSLVNETSEPQKLLFHHFLSVNLVVSWCDELKIPVKVEHAPLFKGWFVIPECSNEEVYALRDRFNNR